jgi:hypothetical protein
VGAVRYAGVQARYIRSLLFERTSAYAQRMKLLCCALLASSAWGSVLVQGIGNVVSDGEDAG